MKEIHNHHIIFVLIFMAVQFIVPGCLDAKEVADVTGRGEAAVVGITAEQGQLIALQRARADAIEKAVGTNVLGSTLVKDSAVVADFIKTFTRGFIVDETVTWLPLGTFRENEKSAPIPVYRVEINAVVMIPEKKTATGFVLDASINRPSYIAGEDAIITAEVSKNAHLAIFNLRADDRVNILYPRNDMGQKGICEPGETFTFPPPDSGQVCEMATVEGHKQDSEAFMVVAVPAANNEDFRFADYFSGERLYSVPEFFERYSR
ncbi:MAG: DUF4384 domain-containing protein, partial [Syntrophaceae bacterium]|nr:DUF4384 domain-containing protein [Syntrophaceae bacterium]